MTQSITLNGLTVGANSITVSRGLLNASTAVYTLTGWDMVINNTTATPATGVLVLFDFCQTPLYNEIDASGARLAPGLVLPPVTGVQQCRTALGMGTPRNSTMGVRVTLLPVGTDATLTRLSLCVEACA